MEVKKKTLIYVGISALVLIIVIGGVMTGFGVFNPDEEGNESISKEIVSCISENSVYYSQTGCLACQRQEEMFGEYASLLNKIDCKYEPEKCSVAGIAGTPTWIINNQKQVGVQTIDTLKILTGCE
ncbi:MAG: hypothetical protein WD876_00155 [Candidatus Pacearchaeota archaeon]